MATKVSVKNGNKRRYPAKITCELQLCATTTATTTDFGYSTFQRKHKFAIIKINCNKLTAKRK